MLQEIRYSGWRNTYRAILEMFGKKRVLISFSGGKDSSLALYFLSKAAAEFHFQFETHAGAFPVHRYTPKEKKRLESYWMNRGVNILWHEVPETDEQIRDTKNPCQSCQKIRKNLLKTFVSEKISDLSELVLVVNFSLWDIVGYSLEHILADIFQKSDEKKGMEKSKRFIETAQRFYPVLNMKEGYTVFRPLISYNGCDILHTLERKDVPFLSIPCEFREYRPKRVLERYYEKMELRFHYENVLDFARKALGLPDASSYTSIEKERYLKDIF